MHFFAFWTLALLALVSVAYSNSVVKVPNNQPSISIVGGVPALPGEFPYMIAIFINGSFSCGGSLLGPSHVLTASHCFIGLNAKSKLTVKANTLTLSGSTGFIQRQVSKYIVHPSFSSSTIDNDVAIMVLTTPIINSTFYVNLPTDNPAATNSKSSKIKTKTVSCPYPCPNTKPAFVGRKTTKKPALFPTYANQLALVTGWGTISSGGDISQNLLKTNVTIQENTICAKQYSSRFVGEHQLCASAPGKDTCQSDSGGPIVVNRVQVGITSYGNGCADPRYAGVYTRITAYLDWIKTTMTNNPGPASG